MDPTALTEMVDRVFNDRYRVEELIGVGAISAVFSAYDSVEARKVALKVFDEALASDERFIDRLLDAVEQAAVLGHPNIVEIYDWGTDGGPYIVSELCEGGSLAALLEAGHMLASSQALVVTLDCARALNYGHEQGAIHRRLTPSNVLFTDDQQVRISDYGLAKVLADAPVAHASRALESVRYASPEQARGRPVGEASDLYSLALVVSEAVSGTPPQVAETVVGTLMERAESPATLDPLLGDLLPPLERCGRVDPEQRPEAEELAIALLAAAETMPRPDALPLVGFGNWSDLDETMLEVAGGTEDSIDAQGEDSSDIDLGDDAGPSSGDSPEGEHLVHKGSSDNADEDLVAVAVAAAIDTADDLAAESVGAEFDDAEFDLVFSRKINPGSGVGSSAASCVAAVVGINELLGNPFDTPALIPYAMEGEKVASGSTHADNIAPALLGGITLIRGYDPLDIKHIPYPSDLWCAVVHPELEIKTLESRKLIPEQVPLKVALQQCGNLAGLVAGLTTGDYPLISRSVTDVFAEPYRTQQLPDFDVLKKNSLNAGSVGTGLSGSGPSVFSLCRGEEMATSVGKVMSQHFTSQGIKAATYISRISEAGCKLI